MATRAQVQAQKVKPRVHRLNNASSMQEKSRIYRQRLGGILMSAKLLKNMVDQLKPSSYIEPYLNSVIHNLLYENEQLAEKVGIKVGKKHSEDYTR